MENSGADTKYDLEKRTFTFAVNVRRLLTSSETKTFNPEDKKQLIRSSGSIGANYIEANEAVSSRDFLLRVKICRKEAKETYFWLRLLIETTEPGVRPSLVTLAQESLELTKIFSAIIQNVEKKIG